MQTRSRHWSVALINATILTTALACAACKERPPTPPTGPSRPAPVIIDGSWTGALTDVAAGAGELEMTTTGVETTATGSFTLRLASRAAPVRGSVAGNVRGPADVVLFLTLDPAAPECSAPGTTYIAELALAGNRLTGTFGPITPCPLLRSGTIELVRR